MAGAGTAAGETGTAAGETGAAAGETGAAVGEAGATVSGEETGATACAVLAAPIIDRPSSPPTPPDPDPAAIHPTHAASATDAAHPNRAPHPRRTPSTAGASTTIAASSAARISTASPYRPNGLLHSARPITASNAADTPRSAAIGCGGRDR